MTKDEGLKMAIKALEMWDKKHIIEMKVGERWIDLSYAINACKEALEQPTVAELNNEYLRDTNVIGLEQSAQEPYGWYDNHDIHTEKQSDESIALYTHPHQWQGLTDDEIVKAFNLCDWMNEPITEFARAIEQALKEKNKC
jgi:hypothetical protein